MYELYLDLDRRLHVKRGVHGYHFTLEMSGRKILDGFTLRNRNGDTAHWSKAESADGALTLTGVVGRNWKVCAEISIAGQRSPRAVCQIQAMYVGEHPVESGFDLEWTTTLTNAEPFVPGIFYSQNRPLGQGAGPRWSPVHEPLDETSSPVWKFRTDRTMTPLVMVRGEGISAAVITSDRFSHGASGLGFAADAGGSSLSLHYPYREEPVKYSQCCKDGDAPVAETFLVQANETVCFGFELYVGLSSGRALMRDLYESREDELAPWIPGAVAAELSADGLMSWHFDEGSDTFSESVGFDKGCEPASVPAQTPRTACAGAVLCGYSLARHGARWDQAGQTKAGLAVLDKITSTGLSPAGLFAPYLPEPESDAGRASELPASASARQTAEAVWFLLKALSTSEDWHTADRLRSWESAAVSNLDFAVRVQRDDGSFGSLYNIETGLVEDWEGVGGLMWIPPLLKAWRYRNAAGAAFPNGAVYKDSAERAGSYYAAMVTSRHLAGSTGGERYGVSLADACAALNAMLALYDETAAESWLELACQAADLALTFRMSYNASFPESTLLGAYGFRTRGADIASPAQQYLSNDGALCSQALLKLWRLTGDDYYFNKARDRIFCFRQFIARSDGDFNSRSGMSPQRYHHTEWTHPKGTILSASDARSAGLTVWIEDWLRKWGTFFVDPTRKRFYCLERIEIEDEDWTAGVASLRNPWDYPIDLTVVNLETANRTVFRFGPGETHQFQI